jgi:hypothetical protein
MNYLPLVKAALWPFGNKTTYVNSPKQKNRLGQQQALNQLNQNYMQGGMDYKQYSGLANDIAGWNMLGNNAPQLHQMSPQQLQEYRNFSQNVDKNYQAQKPAPTPWEPDDQAYVDNLLKQERAIQQKYGPQNQYSQYQKPQFDSRGVAVDQNPTPKPADMTGWEAMTDPYTGEVLDYTNAQGQSYSDQQATNDVTQKSVAQMQQPAAQIGRTDGGGVKMPWDQGFEQAGGVTNGVTLKGVDKPIAGVPEASYNTKGQLQTFQQQPTETFNDSEFDNAPVVQPQTTTQPNPVGQGIGATANLPKPQAPTVQPQSTAPKSKGFFGGVKSLLGAGSSNTRRRPGPISKR